MLLAAEKNTEQLELVLHTNIIFFVNWIDFCEGYLVKNLLIVPVRHHLTHSRSCESPVEITCSIDILFISNFFFLFSIFSLLLGGDLCSNYHSCKGGREET